MSPMAYRLVHCNRIASHVAHILHYACNPQLCYTSLSRQENYMHSSADLLLITDPVLFFLQCGHSTMISSGLCTASYSKNTATVVPTNCNKA